MRYICLLLLFSFFLTPEASSSRRCALISYVKQFDGGCRNSRLWFTKSDTMTWLMAMKINGMGIRSTLPAMVKNKIFHDPSIVRGGRDNKYMDSCAASIFSSHGSNTSSGWSGSMYKRHGGSCSASAANMRLGHLSPGGKSKFFHISTCHSIQWPNIGKWAEAAKGGVYMISGFHGVSWDHPYHARYYWRLARRAYRRSSVFKTWTRTMFNKRTWYSRVATTGAGVNCPIAITYSDTIRGSKRLAKVPYSFNSVTRTRNYLPHYSQIKWIPKCKPTDGRKLP